jgi:hypothetical protein
VQRSNRTLTERIRALDLAQFARWNERNRALDTVPSRAYIAAGH